MAQERRASHEEHRERREADVGHGVFAVTAGPFALVRKTGANASQLSDQGRQDRHGAIESKIAPRRQAKASSAQGETPKFRELLRVRLTQTGAAGSSGPLSVRQATQERDSFAFRTAAEARSSWTRGR